MYQHIALSPLFFNGLKNLRDLHYLELLGNLLTERILCDKEKLILQEYDNKLIELDESGQITPLKKAIIQTLTLNGIVKIKNNTSISKRKESQYKDYKSEKKLLRDDEWKIILSHNISNELNLKMKLEADIEIAGVNEYLKPSIDSRIRAEETIEKEPGQKFNFRNWLLKYIKDSKEIIINDGYVCIGNALPDLNFILRHLNKNIPITIVTLSDEARNPKYFKSDGIEVVKRLEELRNKFPFKKFSFKTIDKKSSLRDRSIVTDLWNINHGHAFGSVKGEYVEKHFIISVKKKE